MAPMAIWSAINEARYGAQWPALGTVVTIVIQPMFLRTGLDKRQVAGLSLAASR
jgi:hypothetical protein